MKRQITTVKNNTCEPSNCINSVDLTILHVSVIYIIYSYTGIYMQSCTGNILYKWLTKVYICNFYILLESEIFFRNLASLATVAVRYKRQYLL